MYFAASENLAPSERKGSLRDSGAINISSLRDRRLEQPPNSFLSLNFRVRPPANCSRRLTFRRLETFNQALIF
jgi:hypothetical protein